VAYFFSSIALALSIFSFLYFRSLYKNQNRSTQILAGAERIELQNLLNDIELCTDRDTQLVNARVEKLKELLAEADRRIGAFEHDLETRKRRDSVYAELGRKKKPALPPAPAKKTVAETRQLDVKDQILLLAAKGASAAQIAAELKMNITEVEMTLVLKTKYKNTQD
jgi:hypothetical protein